MKSYIVAIFLLVLLVGAILGVTMRFFDNFGANIGRNHMNDLGVDIVEEEDDPMR